MRHYCSFHTRFSRIRCLRRSLVNLKLMFKSFGMREIGKRCVKLLNSRQGKPELMVSLIISCILNFFTLIFYFSTTEQLALFLFGEAKLEHYLDENPPYEHQASKAKFALAEAKTLLTNSAGKDRSRATFIDSQLLLAKLHFAMG